MVARDFEYGPATCHCSLTPAAALYGRSPHIWLPSGSWSFGHPYPTLANLESFRHTKCFVGRRRRYLRAGIERGPGVPKTASYLASVRQLVVWPSVSDTCELGKLSSHQVFRSADAADRAGPSGPPGPADADQPGAAAGSAGWPTPGPPEPAGPAIARITTPRLPPTPPTAPAPPAPPVPPMPINPALPPAPPAGRPRRAVRRG